MKIEIELNDYQEIEPKDSLDKLYLLRVQSQSDGTVYFTTGRWAGNSFMSWDAEESSWVGPVQYVTHWADIEGAQADYS